MEDLDFGTLPIYGQGRSHRYDGISGRDEEAESQEDEYGFRPDPELIARGWEQRFVADPVRAEEAIQLYEEMGYEVRAEPITPENMRAECGGCPMVTYVQFVTLYTRKPGHQEGK